MRYRRVNLDTWTDFQGERDRGMRRLTANQVSSLPDFARDASAGQAEFNRLLLINQLVALAEIGPEGKAAALMLMVAFVGGGLLLPALISHPVSADTGFGHSYIAPDAAPNHPAVLSADCDTPVNRPDILAIAADGNPTEPSFNDGLKAMPADPSAGSLACRFRQIAASLKSGELRPHDIETKRHLGIFFGENSDFQLLADIKDWGGLAIDPAEAAGGVEMGLILVDRSKNMAESLLEQVSFFYARANGYEARPGSPSRGAVVAYALLNDIFGFAGEFDSTTRSTCVTHQDRAASRFNQPTVIIDRAVWTPRIAVGSERSIFLGNPELRSSDARIGMLFREIIGKSNVDALIRNLRAEKLDAVAVEIAKGKFLVVAGFDPESENVDFPGLRTFAAGDQDPAHAVGDGAWMVRCGPAKPKPTETPSPTKTPTPTQVQIQEATQAPSGGGGGEEHPSEKTQEVEVQEKSPDPYDTGGSVEQDQANRENKGTGGTGGNEDTKPNEP